MKRISIILIALAMTSLPLHAQSRWQSAMGTYLSGDAEMYYVGPSFLAEGDYLLTENISIGSYAHFFQKSIANVHRDKFRAFSIAVLLQLDLDSVLGKKLYIAAGLAWQDAWERYYGQVETDRSVIVPAYRIGYRIPLRSVVLCPEFCTTGPYVTEGSIELFTLPSLGLRIYKSVKKGPEKR